MPKKSPVSPLNILVAASGLKFYEVAQKADVTAFRIWQIRRGLKPATDDERRRIAKVLKVQISDLGI